MTQTISPKQPINTNHQPNEPHHKKTPQSMFAPEKYSGVIR